MEGRKLDVLFVFQSIMERAITLRNSFSRAQKIFGDAILHSTIVTLNKTDVKEPTLTKRIEIVEEAYRQENIPYITWVNKYSLHYIVSRCKVQLSSAV